MLFFPNCKINIGLDILRKRPDGYHDIETVMYPVHGLCDGLEIIRTDVPGGMRFTSSGLPIDCLPEKNLVVKAFHLMHGKYGLDGVAIHLHKIIPSGAGLGGGSADAAFTIAGLNTIFGLGLPHEKLEALAAELGSDVPFFVRNTPQFCAGRGEVMTPADISLEEKYLLIVNPGIHISTAEAYAGTTPSEPAYSLVEAVRLPVEKWQEKVGNSFEESLFKAHPRLGLLKKSLYESGAVYASMTGSGSAVYGIFDNTPSCISGIYKDAHLITLR